MDYVTTLAKNVNLFKLRTWLSDFLLRYQLHNNSQITITSTDGNNNWTESNGLLSKLSMPESSYNVLNKALTGTCVGSIVQEYDSYYRWRLLRLAPKHTYSVHVDANYGQINKRIHIPIITNPSAVLVFYNNDPARNTTTTIQTHNLKAGNVYEVNTTGFHTAVNYGNTDRYHLVGVKYE